MKKSEKAGQRGWIFAGAATLAIALVASLSLLVFPMLRTPQQVAAEAAPPPPSRITAIAEKRKLSAKVVMRATVAPGSTIDLKPSDALVSAGMVVTAIPAGSRATVDTGAVLLEANGEPLVAMNWPFPAYRDIHPDDIGPDVEQLQKTLAALGYVSGTTSTFDEITRRGLKQLYKDLGYEAPTVGTGAAGDGSGMSSGATSGSKEASASSSLNAAANKEIILPARNVVVIPNPTNALTSIPLKVGEKIGAETQLAKLNGQVSTVIGSTTPDRAAKINPGAVGTLTGPTGEAYPVEVTSVAASISEVPGLGQGVKIDLSFSDPAKVAPVTAEGATLKLEVPTGSAVEGVALPITALYSTPDGTTYVIPDSTPDRRINVTVGANVDGWVEIKPGSDLEEGDAVVLGSASE